jgi:hypothetical protein
MAADLDIRVQPMLMPKGIDFYRFLIGNYWTHDRIFTNPIHKLV